MYDVLQRDLSLIESEAREYYDLVSRLGRKQGLCMYSHAAMLKKEIHNRIVQIHKVAGKLFSGETGQ